MSVAASTPCVNLGNHSATTVITESNVVNVVNSVETWTVPASKEEVNELRTKLELIENDMKIFPGLVGEILKGSFDRLTYACNVMLDKVPISTTAGADTGFYANTQGFLMAIRDIIQEEVNTRINFTEINQLRARVKQLEEDLQYRTKVADKLREDYKK